LLKHEKRKKDLNDAKKDLLRLSSRYGGRGHSSFAVNREATYIDEKRHKGTGDGGKAAIQGKEV